MRGFSRVPPSLAWTGCCLTWAAAVTPERRRARAIRSRQCCREGSNIYNNAVRKPISARTSASHGGLCLHSQSILHSSAGRTASWHTLGLKLRLPHTVGCLASTPYQLFLSNSHIISTAFLSSARQKDIVRECHEGYGGMCICSAPTSQLPRLVHPFIGGPRALSRPDGISKGPSPRRPCERQGEHKRGGTRHHCRRGKALQCAVLHHSGPSLRPRPTS